VSQIGEVFAARSNPARESSRMLQGWREKVDRAKQFAARYDKECEWAGVTFAPEEIVELLQGCGYGG
jgi:hypothetical protein